MERTVPYLAAMLLDAVDLATFGPLGLWLGFILGALTGWFLAESLGFKRENRWMGSALGGLYCMLPGTSVLPVATVATAILNFGERRRGEAIQEGEEPITVDYREVEEGDDPPR